MTTGTNKMLRMLAVMLLLGAQIQSTTQDPNACYIQGSAEVYINNVKENTPIGSVIGYVNVTGSSSEVTLAASDNDYLLLNSSTRAIIVKSSLDTDRGLSTVYFEVTCTHTPGQSVSIPVFVVLLDVNDNAPFFNKEVYHFNISEGSPVGSTIINSVTASDADSETSGNALIVYSIPDGPFSDYFEIDLPTRAEIRLKKPLDFENMPQMSFVILAQDNPSDKTQTLSASATISIDVLDVDDLPPVFDRDLYLGSLSVGTPVGTTITRVTAYDQDKLNSSVKYDIIASDGVLGVRNLTGEVYLATEPREPVQMALIKATQIDNPLMYGVSLFRLNVEGTANGSFSSGPFFPKTQYQFTLSESQPVGSTVGSVPAYYRLKDVQLTYSTHGHTDKFQVDNEGNIVLLEALDYEASVTEFEVVVMATDNVMTSSATVHVRVTGENDNTPTLAESDVVVTSERRRGDTIFHLKATDLDKGDAIAFELKTFQELFLVNKTGHVVLIADNSEYTLNQYILVVKVTDDGVPPRDTHAMITVNFPKLSPASSQALAMAGNDTLAYVFGGIAAVLLMIVIILIVYIIRRRMYTEEQLDKARLNRDLDPRGITYRAGDPTSDPSHLHMKFDGEYEGGSDISLDNGHHDDGMSSSDVQFDQKQQEHSEIKLETAMIPYGNSYNNYEERRAYQNGSLKTFHAPEGSSSGESNHSDSTGDSNRGLVKLNGRRHFPQADNSASWENNEHAIPHYHSQDTLPMPESKPKGKPELTVYF